MLRYRLNCLECGTEYSDDGFRLNCDNEHKPSLLRAIYPNSFKVHSENPGMFKYYDFLPVQRILNVEGEPITYKSTGLSEYLGLNNLYIIFNGYWPEKGAKMMTASFKELEAPSVLARLPESSHKTIVVASAGNTGRAFANICSANNIPLILVVPQLSIRVIWSVKPFNRCIKLISVTGNSDYTDAINLSNRIVRLEDFFPEGGAKNVARRDGMGTALLSAAVEMQRIPDHYFQAIGSGTGGIAAWEAFLRLKEISGFRTDRKMKLHLSQNYPFTPMIDAWNERSSYLPELDKESSKSAIREIDAKVLSNRKPPYSIVGGVYDVMKESNGIGYSVTNSEAREAQRLFKNKEGIDICSAAGVAVASLLQAVKKRLVSKDDYITLNITGGGEEKLKEERELFYLKPFASFNVDEIYNDNLDDKLIEKLASNMDYV